MLGYRIAIVILMLGCRCVAVANEPPASPTIAEPVTDGQVVSAADVHMEATSFDDPDGDDHACSDWEIRTVGASELVWSASCVTGLEAVHVHLGDGDFLGSHAGLDRLLHETSYLLRVRFRDDSNAANDWSEWSERSFVTAAALPIEPLRLDEVHGAPAPTWTTALTGDPVVLDPRGDGPVLIVDTPGGPLLEIRGLDGVTNDLIFGDALASDLPVRVRVQAGGTRALSLPDTDLVFVDHHCGSHRLLLPAMTVVTGAERVLWFDDDGGAYDGEPRQTEPAFDTPARISDIPWAVQQPGYVVDVVATGFALPVNIAFVPEPGPEPCDPLFYVTELYGTIKVVCRDGTVGDYATDLLDFEPDGDFPGSGEIGLTGIAVHAATGDVFASMLYAGEGNPGDPKIVRFSSSDGGLTASTETIVLDMVGEKQDASHQISHLGFRPDGTLMVHMGDGFYPETARDLDSLRGKILCINVDGSPAATNPFYDTRDGISAIDYIYAYGFRNPFGGTYRHADGAVYEVENGQSIDRFARVAPGQDFAWDGDHFDLEVDALYNWEPAHAPVNVVFVEPEVFEGSGFPPSSMGHAFVTESGPTYASGSQTLGKRISEFVIDLDGSLVSGPFPLIEYIGTGRATCAGLAAGPDGLYFTDLYVDLAGDPMDPGASILRVRYEPDSDCNGNGVPDVIDIEDGVSADCNDDCVPDECNIADGSSLDDNGNGIPDECECPADLNGDGFAGIDDLILLLGLWGQPGLGDLDGSGVVDVGDVLSLFGQWGSCPE